MCVSLFFRELYLLNGKSEKKHTAFIIAMSSFPSLNQCWSLAVTAWRMEPHGLYVTEAVTTSLHHTNIMVQHIWVTIDRLLHTPFLYIQYIIYTGHQTRKQDSFVCCSLYIRRSLCSPPSLMLPIGRSVPDCGTAPALVIAGAEWRTNSFLAILCLIVKFKLLLFYC